MSAKHVVQWSNDAHRSNGYGLICNEQSEPVKSKTGYIPQALEILSNPKNYKAQDIRKAKNIQKSW